MRCRAWRSSRPGAGCSRNIESAPSGSAISSARSRARPAATGVAERVPGDRLQQESLVLQGPIGYRSGAVQDRRERGGRRVRVVLGEPQRRRGDADIPTVAVLVAEVGEDLLGAAPVSPRRTRASSSRARAGGTR